MSIQLYLRQNGNSNDASSNGYNMTDANITYSSNLGINGVATFNGSSSRQTRVASANLQSNNRTFSLLVRRTGAGTGENQIIILPSQNGGSGKGFGIRDGGTNLQFLNSNFSAWVGTGNTLSSIKFDYLVGIQDGSGTRLYKNKILVASDAQTGTTGAGGWAIGSNYSAAQDFFKGDIDEVIIDNTAWSNAQFSNQYGYYKGFF